MRLITRMNGLICGTQFNFHLEVLACLLLVVHTKKPMVWVEILGSNPFSLLLSNNELIFGILNFEFMFLSRRKKQCLILLE